MPSNRSCATLACVAVSWIALPACTLFVLDGVDDALACDDTHPCPAAHRCVEDTCVAVETPAGAPPDVELVGPDGGTVEGPAGVSLVVPPGALASGVGITMRQTTSTTPGTGFVPAGPVIRIAPSVTLATAATVLVPDDGSCSACAIFLAPAESAADDPTNAAAWEALPTTSDGVHHTAALPRLGLFSWGLANEGATP